MSLIAELHRGTGRSTKQPRRPLEGRTRTRAAGQRDMHQHCSPSRLAGLSRHYRQRTPLGPDYEIDWLGRDQIAAARARRLAQH